VRGLRYRSVPVIRSLYRVDRGGVASRVESAREDGIDGFVSRLRVDGELPAVQIANPRLSWNGEDAIVKCVVIWNLVDRRGSRFRWTTEERFVLSPEGNRYVITDARTTPFVFRYAHKPTMIRRLVQDVASGP
jgi:hypothetical protein